MAVQDGQTDGVVMVLALTVWGVGLSLLIGAVRMERRRLWDPQCAEGLARYLCVAVDSRRADGPSPLELEGLVASACAPVAPARPERQRHLTAA